MASLFPDEGRPSGGRAPFRKYPARPKAVQAELPPLQPGWVLAHCDGGARGNPGPAGFGAVVVDDAGAPLAELSEFIGFRTNNVAEYSGLLAVLAWALEHGHPKLRVVSDSELMVKQIQGKYKVNSPDLKPLHEEARKRIALLEGFEIHHALRHKNKVADRLANEAMDRGMGRSPQALATPSAVQKAEAAARDRAAAASAPAPQEASGSGLERGREPVRGLVREGVVRLLGGATLPEGTYVRVTPE